MKKFYFDFTNDGEWIGEGEIPTSATFSEQATDLRSLLDTLRVKLPRLCGCFHEKIATNQIKTNLREITPIFCEENLRIKNPLCAHNAKEGQAHPYGEEISELIRMKILDISTLVEWKFPMASKIKNVDDKAFFDSNTGKYSLPIIQEEQQLLVPELLRVRQILITLLERMLLTDDTSMNANVAL